MSYGFSYTTRLDGQVIFASHPNGLAAAVDSALTQVEAAVAGVAATIASRGAIAGQTWTGTHNFTGATLSAATPPTAAAGTEVATAAFVLAKVLATPSENLGGFLKASADINGGM